MGKIVKFPRIVSTKAGKAKRQKTLLSLEKIPNKNDHCLTGHSDFTCPECGLTSKLSFVNMIFKIMEMYCGGCGTKYQIKNPAFYENKDKKFGNSLN